jgi:hypothetical protein
MLVPGINFGSPYMMQATRFILRLWFQPLAVVVPTHLFMTMEDISRAFLICVTARPSPRQAFRISDVLDMTLFNCIVCSRLQKHFWTIFTGHF